MDFLQPLLTRIAEALEKRVPQPLKPIDWAAADAFLWDAVAGTPTVIPRVEHVDLDLLQGINPQIDILRRNTEQFAASHAANNALLWGAKGMGKSSLIKAIHAAIVKDNPGALALIEIWRDDIADLPRLLAVLRESQRRFILFCDDLSFEKEDETYKSLKAVLDGGLQGRPDNVLLYATSNRRHLMAREMIENERSTAINPTEAIDEKVSLSDRFGLWIGFHNCDQITYIAMVEAYARHYKLAIPADQLKAGANEWAITRGARSGRVAWQFIQDLRGHYPDK